MTPVDYDQTELPKAYAAARAIDTAMLGRWMATFGEALPPGRPLAMLDLGSGTGRFTPALAERFGGPVLGVEPSDKMRAVAEAEAPHPRVTYLAGRAEDIPLGDAAVDGVLMFLTWHHVRDKPRGAAEIARVLQPGGRVLLRGEFSDRPPKPWWNAYFPSLEAIGTTMFPTLPETLKVFSAAGLRQVALVEVEEQYAASPAEAVARLRLRGVSTFVHLTDAEWDEGLARVEADLAAGRLTVPRTGRSDLLVLGRG